MREWLRYDKALGWFFWRKLKANQQEGARAGCVNSAGYRQIQVNKKTYLEHKLAWFFTHGVWPVWPSQHIDHINGDTQDNRIVNLRLVGSRENQQNQVRHRAGRLVGATFDRARNKWQASIKIRGRRIYLGRFDTEREAHTAYMAAKDVQWKR